MLRVTVDLGVDIGPNQHQHTQFRIFYDYHNVLTSCSPVPSIPIAPASPTFY
jgi:hypothetical protein